MKEENCTCTDECLGYLTKTCKKVEEEPKQETLEEAGEKLYPNRESFLHRFQNIERKAFTEGAKWQMERSYSEEEVIRILIKVYEDIGKRKIPNQVVLASWFEQFKKK
jgi:Ni,Fe-hydrogenase III component G